MRTVPLAVLVLLLAACAAPGRAADPPPASGPDLPALLLEYAADERGLSQFWSLPSPARRAQQQALALAWRARLDALDFAALPRDAQVDWLVLDNYLRAESRRRRAEAERLEEVAGLLPFAADVIALEEARWTLQGPGPEEAAGRLDALARQVKALRERVKREEPRAAPAGADSEEAVTAQAVKEALGWLARHQHPDGHWSAADFAAECARAGSDPPCGGAGNPQFDVGVTSLALLAFMADGQTARLGTHHDAVRRGVVYLRDIQQPDGSFAIGSLAAQTYEHALATLALGEYFALTGDNLLLKPFAQGLEHLARLRAPDGGWRYAAYQPGAGALRQDMSATGWAILAMATARAKGLERFVDETAWQDALRFLDEMTDPATGITGYDRAGGRPSRDASDPARWPDSQSEALTAVGVTCRLFSDPQAQRPGNLERIARGLAAIEQLPPLRDERLPGRWDLHFWAFGSLAVHNAGSEGWSAWRNALRAALHPSQELHGCARGSWDPSLDPFGATGGRIYATALAVLALRTGETTQPFSALNRTTGALQSSRPRYSQAGYSVDLAPAPPAPLHPSASHARRAAAEVERLLGALADWYRHDEAFRPDFSWWCARPYEQATQELRDYARHLREELAGLKGADDDPLVGDPIGRQALLDELQAERLDATPEELVALGEAELEWCVARMREAAAELGLGDDWRAALERVKDLHVAPGAQDDLVRGQALEALDFLDARGLVTVPPLCRDTFRFTMLDEGAQKTLPFAAYGGQEMLVAFPTRAMEHDAKLAAMRGNNEHFSRIVTPHELVPGHHLQGYMAQRHATHRRFASTPFLVEGWALYWELRLWDLGWARGPEDRLGMLFWRAHRAARIVVSLRFHLGSMTPQQMVDDLVERVGHERDNATGEVRRYVGGDYGPLYQCAYLVGGLQLAALHDELVGAGRLSERAFHDAVLAQGPVPVAFVRAALADGPLDRDVPPRLGVRRRGE